MTKFLPKATVIQRTRWFFDRAEFWTGMASIAFAARFGFGDNPADSQIFDPFMDTVGSRWLWFGAFMTLGAILIFLRPVVDLVPRILIRSIALFAMLWWTVWVYSPDVLTFYLMCVFSLNALVAFSFEADRLLTRVRNGEL